uniref:Uncharacterized protein n=1 Tax=Sus scrofa TaxID=9823 RepID=A0A8D0IP03_PIG
HPGRPLPPSPLDFPQLSGASSLRLAAWPTSRGSPTPLLKLASGGGGIILKAWGMIMSIILGIFFNVHSAVLMEDIPFTEKEFENFLGFSKLKEYRVWGARAPACFPSPALPAVYSPNPVIPCPPPTSPILAPSVEGVSLARDGITSSPTSSAWLQWREAGAGFPCPSGVLVLAGSTIKRNC